MKIEIDIEELIGNALDNMDSSDYFNCVDMDDLVSSRLADMDNDVILEGVDVEGLVKDAIGDMDLIEGIDICDLISDELQGVDLVEGIDLEKIIVDHISELIGKDEFEQYVISSNRIKVLEDELQAVRIELSRLNSTIINQTLCQVRKWYQIW